MKVKNLVGERFKERPSDCVVDSHALMVRGGYIKQVANGIFSLFPPARRVTQKIEQIIREEMDRIDGQEVLFPVVLPGSLWMESGRYQSIDNTLARFDDRNGTPMVLGMTHEEAAVQLVREYASTYNRYPFMIYQIQTKFRDEARPRAGLIRVREFTMKDAYSFHTSQEDLEAYYARCYRAYERIYARAGAPQVIAVKSDSGMMGGSVSHEYMLLTDIGEDSIVICPECGYRANMEAAENIVGATRAEDMPLTKVATPDKKTIEEVVEYLHGDTLHSVKAVVYQTNAEDKFVVAFLRGDLEVNETKLTEAAFLALTPWLGFQASGSEIGIATTLGLDEVSGNWQETRITPTMVTETVEGVKKGYVKADISGLNAGNYNTHMNLAENKQANCTMDEAIDHTAAPVTVGSKKYYVWADPTAGQDGTKFYGCLGLMIRDIAAPADSSAE